VLCVTRGKRSVFWNLTETTATDACCQARLLFATLGYPPEKAEFKGRSITLDDFIFITNGKRTTGALGKEDLEGECIAQSE
jgi:hypothetical protein